MSVLGQTSLPSEVEEVGHKVIGCAIEVHRRLGPGFKERIYSEALCLEMDSTGLSFEREKPIVVRYRHWEIRGHRLDLVVGGLVIVELKTVRRLKDLHRRQVVSYLKATHLQLGLLLNFNVSVLRSGIRRVIL
jgi:GxxExxY protein